MADAKFPRVLIVSSSVFNRVTGGGIMLSNLFEGWSREAIATLHCDTALPDETICSNFYKLTRDEMRWSFPFSLVQKPAATVGGAPGASTAAAPASSGLLKSVLGEHMPWSTRISEQLAKWIDAFRPEILYVLPGMPYMDLVLEIKKRWNVPLVIHMMDDWPSVYGKKGLLRPLVRGQALCQLKRLMRGADVHLAISEPMCHAYEKRYGFSFQPFYSGVHVADYLKKAPIGPKPKKPFEIVYVGSILPNAQLTSLIQVARVVNEMAQKGSEIRFSIYSSFAETYRDKLAVGPAVRLQGSLSDADFFSTLVNANALLIPVNFDAESRAFVRYSFPAKLPAYMLSGTPILVYGPRDVTYVNQAAEQGWGYLVDEEGLTGVEKAIRELMVSDDLSQKLGRTAQALSAAQHDVVKIRQEFQRCLLNATRRR